MPDQPHGWANCRHRPGWILWALLFVFVAIEPCANCCAEGPLIKPAKFSLKWPWGKKQDETADPFQEFGDQEQRQLASSLTGKPMAADAKPDASVGGTRYPWPRPVDSSSPGYRPEPPVQGALYPASQPIGAAAGAPTPSNISPPVTAAPNESPNGGMLYPRSRIAGTSVTTPTPHPSHPSGWADPYHRATNPIAAIANQTAASGTLYPQSPFAGSSAAASPAQPPRATESPLLAAERAGNLVLPNYARANYPGPKDVISATDKMRVTTIAPSVGAQDVSGNPGPTAQQTTATSPAHRVPQLSGSSRNRTTGLPPAHGMTPSDQLSSPIGGVLNSQPDVAKKKIPAPATHGGPSLPLPPQTQSIPVANARSETFQQTVSNLVARVPASAAGVPAAPGTARRKALGDPNAPFFDPEQQPNYHDQYGWQQGIAQSSRKRWAGPTESANASLATESQPATRPQHANNQTVTPAVESFSDPTYLPLPPIVIENTKTATDALPTATQPAKEISALPLPPELPAAPGVPVTPTPPPVNPTPPAQPVTPGNPLPTAPAAPQNPDNPASDALPLPLPPLTQTQPPTGLPQTPASTPIASQANRTAPQPIVDMTSAWQPDAPASHAPTSLPESAAAVSGAPLAGASATPLPQAPPAGRGQTVSATHTPGDTSARVAPAIPDMRSPFPINEQIAPATANAVPQQPTAMPVPGVPLNGQFNANQIDQSIWGPTASPPVQPPTTPPVQPPVQPLAQPAIPSADASDQTIQTSATQAISHPLLASRESGMASRESGPDNGNAPDAPVNAYGEVDRASQVIAIVGDQSILAGDLLFQINQMLAPYVDKVPEEELEKQRTVLMKQMLPRLIENKLVYLDFLRMVPPENHPEIKQQVIKDFNKTKLGDLMKKSGANSPAELDTQLRKMGSSLAKQQQMFMEQIVGRQMVQQNVDVRSEVSHDEMLAYYRTHAADYAITAQAKWERIMIRWDAFPSRDEAIKQLESLGNQVLRGTPFSEVAKQGSQGPRAKQGGAFDWTESGSLKSSTIDRLLFSLPVGKLSRPVQDEDGIHIVRVVDRREAGRVPFAKVQAKIKEAIQKERFEKQVDEYLAKLSQESTVWNAFESQ